jgi:hypothetical protein
MPKARRISPLRDLGHRKGLMRLAFGIVERPSLASHFAP